MRDMKEKRVLFIKMSLSILVLAIIFIAIFEIFIAEKDRAEYIAGKKTEYNAESIQSNEIVIPDKYNTGANENIETIPTETWYDPLSQTEFSWKNSNGYYNVDVTKGTANEIIIENKKFDYDVRFINEENLENLKKYTFINCQFKGIKSDYKSYENINLVFEKCSLNTFAGSDASFDNCAFGGTSNDGINPFQNVKVTNSLFSNFSNETKNDAENKRHTDGVQMFGYNDVEVKNIKFYNCRFEIPRFLFSKTDGTVNAAIMIQPEFADLHEVNFEKCIVNGGGYSIYINAKNNRKVYNLTVNDIKVGCARWYGSLYPSTAIPTNEYEANNIVYNNVVDTQTLYIGSVWKENDGIHISVTNDTSDERKLRVELSTGEIKEFNIKACPNGKTWWDKGDTVKESYDKYNYDDMPFDLNLNVGNAEWIKCYDGENLIRTQSFKDNNDDTIQVQSISLNKQEETIEIGNKILLTHTILPITATNKNVTWSTSKPEIATVENGVVTGIAEGNTIITVNTEDGNKTAQCTVNVKKTYIPIIATIKYDINDLTDQDVTATILFNKENVTITNNNGKNTYKFTQNGEFTFKYQDNEGNKGEEKAKVTWINKKEDNTIDNNSTTNNNTTNDNTTNDNTTNNNTANDNTTNDNTINDNTTNNKITDNNTMNSNIVNNTINDNEENNMSYLVSENKYYSNNALPKTGIKSLFIMTIILIVPISIISYKKYNYYKNIK